jgi:PEP-CTERM motif
MKKLLKHRALLVACSSVLAAVPAYAANSFYAPGDLVLYFQKEGSTNTVYAGLGNAATLYRGSAAGAADGVNRINFLDLNTTLTSAFGAGWASDTSIYSGLAGVFSTNTTNNVLTDLDPSRTLYISRSRDAVGNVGSANSNTWDLTLAGNTAMSSGATGITAQNNAFEVNYDAQTTVSITSVSTIDDQNPFLVPGQQGNAFGAFEGGVQQRGAVGSFGTMGDAGEVEFALDLYRILAKNTVPGQVAGDLRVGSYEGTITVGNTGLVSFVAVPEPSALALSGLAVGAMVLRRRRSA